jgi:hypothetical protein
MTVTPTQKQEFKLAADALHLAKTMASGHVEPMYRISDESLAVRAALHVKATQTYGAIFVAVDQGLVGASQLLSRALFETALVQEFLCRRSIKLPAAKKLGGRLSFDFRTDLYLAFCAVKGRRMIREQGALGNRKEWNATIKFMHAQCVEYERKVGAPWMKRLEASNTCTGENARDLAKFLGASYLKWYNATYRLHSRAAHATDCTSYAQWRDGDDYELELFWYNFEEAYESSFGVSTCVFLAALMRFTRMFRVPVDIKNQLLALYEEFSSIA